jgi:hypothetical protein
MKGWKRSEQGDMAQLAEFLEREEYRCVTLSEHLLQLFSFRGTTCRMRSKSTQECWIHYGETEDGKGEITINGIAVMNSNGAAWCLLPREGDETADLAGKFDVTGRLASLSGPEEDAERLRASIARIPLSVGHYSLMRSTIGTQAQFQPAGIRIRRASMRDIVAVCSLHAAYEEEELPKAPRHLMPSLPERMAGLLKRQVVVLAFLEGRLAGKANTNARGAPHRPVGRNLCEAR